MTPTVGRIVHFHTVSSNREGVAVVVPQAALVTQVIWEQSVFEGQEDKPVFRGKLGMTIFTPLGIIFAPSVQYSEEPKPGHWSWPPKV